MEEMLELAEKAVEGARIWKLKLDYTAESLEALEKLSQMIFRAKEKQLLPEEALDGFANLYGAYLGEVLLRCGLADLGFAWMEGEEDEIGIGREDLWFGPLAKVYKRITQGPEHSLLDFFEVAFGMAIGAVNLDDPRVHIMSKKEAS